MRETAGIVPLAPAVYSDDLKCSWISWGVVTSGWLVVHIKPGHCTDMTGAIRVGLRLMPDVCEITVVSGNEIDIVYRRDAGGWFTESDQWSIWAAACCGAGTPCRHANSTPRLKERSDHERADTQDG